MGNKQVKVYLYNAKKYMLNISMLYTHETVT